MRTLKKEFDQLVANKLAGSFQAPSGSDWVQSQHFDYAYYNVQYIDLAGVSMNDETVFIEAAAVQRGTYHYILPAAAGDRVYIWDVMTSIPIDISSQAIQEELFTRGWGMPGTRLNYEHVLYHRMQVFSYDVDFANGTAIKVDETQCGSLEATASDRIYCYRVVSFTTAGDNSGGVISPARYILNVDKKEEPTFQHLMRMKRSYDLQQSHDED